jgi:type VI protein secretion system component VasF
MNNLTYWKKFTDLLFYLEEAGKTLLPENISDADVIIEFRGNLRQMINSIEEICEEKYGTKTTYYILFPIVVYCDEIISRIFAENNISWPKMQKEIYNIEDGGEKIYELIDQLIEQPTFPEIVYQTNYIILKTDFKGKLIDESAQKSKSYYLKNMEKLLINNLREHSDSSEKKWTAFKTPSEKFKEYFKKYFYVPTLGGVGIIYLITIFILAG